MKYEVEQNLLQAILNYLGKQPYAEVHQLIAGLGQVKRMEGQEGSAPMEPDTD